MKAIITLIYVSLLCLLAGSFMASFVDTDSMPWLQILPSFDLFLLGLSFLMLGVVWLLRLKPTFGVLVMLLSCLVAMVHQGVPSHDTCSEKAEKGHRLVSLNVDQLTNDTTVASATIDKLNQLDADIILLQEFGLYYKWPDVETVKRDFANRLNVPYAEFSPKKGNIFGTAIFSKYPIIRVDTLFQLLTQTNEAKRYTIALPNGEVKVTNVHLMSYNLFARRKTKDGWSVSSIMRQRLTQAQLVLQFEADFIVGDFNASPGSQVYGSFSKSYLDAFEGWLASTHNLLWTRLDHIFFKPGWCIKQQEILTNFPSDHNGLMVDFHERK